MRPRGRYISYVQLAAEEFLRGTRYKSPHTAIAYGRRTEKQWLMFLDYYRAWVQRHYHKQRIWRCENGILLRRAPRPPRKPGRKAGSSADIEELLTESREAVEMG